VLISVALSSSLLFACKLAETYETEPFVPLKYTNPSLLADRWYYAARAQSAALYDPDEKLILVTGNKKVAPPLRLILHEERRTERGAAHTPESNLTALLFQRCVTD